MIKSAVLAAGGAAVLGLLAGCAPTAGSANPVDWWHSLEGGRIAEQRPPPPNVDAPYPNLASVPERPVPTDAATRGRIASGLEADRADAAYAGAGMPGLYAPHTAPQAPARAAAPADDSPSASLAAASSPSGGASRRASRAESAPLVPLPTAAPPGQGATQNGAPPNTDSPNTGAMEVAEATMPAAPPRAPYIQGVDVPATTVPTPPPLAPAAPPPAPKATVTATSVLVPFLPGTAEIPQDTQDALRTLALHRGAAAMDAIGYGDAAGGDPAAQSAALPLALARARAIAAVLTASGVPAAQVRFQAEAEGRGGAAHVVN